MSKLDGLPEVKQPRTCVACKSFVAECVVPVGEASAAMCWLCAHHVIDHEVPVHKAHNAECECLPHDVYPKHVHLRRLTAPQKSYVFSTPAESGEEIRLVAEYTVPLTRWQQILANAAEHLPHIKDRGES